MNQLEKKKSKEFVILGTGQIYKDEWLSTNVTRVQLYGMDMNFVTLSVCLELDYERSADLPASLLLQVIHCKTD